MARKTAALSEVLIGVRRIAPERLGEAWDAVGLQVGFADQSIRRGLLCIDLTEPVLEEALEAKADLVVAYHPPIFKPLEALTDQSEKSRIILRAAAAGLAIYSPHTALDAAAGGVNRWLADGLGQGEVWPIKPRGLPDSTDGQATAEEQLKLVTFVPHDAADALRSALSNAGAGNIGQYSECTFGVAGEGTFRGSDASNPTVGQAGRFERERELRMEMVVDRASLRQAVAALWQAHPYEEPPYDVYRLEPVPKPTQAEGDAAASPEQTGQGRVLELQTPVKLSTLVQRVKKRLGMSRLFVGGRHDNDLVKRIGVCVGSGASVLDDARGGLDAMVTGEMSHHRQLAVVARNTAVILAGHTQTERPYLPTYRQHLLEQPELSAIDWRISETDQPPDALR